MQNKGSPPIPVMMRGLTEQWRFSDSCVAFAYWICFDDLRSFSRESDSVGELWGIGFSVYTKQTYLYTHIDRTCHYLDHLDPIHTCMFAVKIWCSRTVSQGSHPGNMYIARKRRVIQTSPAKRDDLDRAGHTRVIQGYICPRLLWNGDLSIWSVQYL